MGTIQFIVHAFAIGIAVGLAYLLMLFIMPTFVSAFEEDSPGSLEYLMLAFIYFSLPLLFTISGIGIVAASDQAVQAAVPLKPAARVGLEWASQLGSGALVLSIMSVCVARVFSSRFCKGFGNTVFFIAMMAVLLFAVIGYIERRYLELIVENVIEMGLLPSFALVAGIAAVLTEALVRGSRRIRRDPIEN